MKTIQIAERTYGVGFWWQPRPEGPAGRKVMLKLARETAASFADEGYDCVALQAEQYGLTRAGGEFHKTFSLAGAIKPLKGDAFLGIFRLTEDLWWVCGIVRGLIVAEGDAVFGTRAEAEAHVESSLRPLIETAGLTEVVFETPEASRDYLKPLLWPSAPLRPLEKSERSQRLLRRGALLAVVLLLAGAGAFWLYGSYEARREARLGAARTAAREAQKRERLANPERYFQKAWRAAPGFLAAGKQCADALLSLPAAVNAWRLEEAVCRPGAALQIFWAHTRGASFVALPAAGARLSGPQEAGESRPLTTLAARSPDEERLLSQAEATALLYQITQNLGASLRLDWEEPEQFRIDEETVVFAPWRRGRFELSQIPAISLLGPDLFGALGHPGAMLDALGKKNNDFNIKGYIHVTEK